jgi:hypothetical protein
MRRGRIPRPQRGEGIPTPRISSGVRTAWNARLECQEIDQPGFDGERQAPQSWYRVFGDRSLQGYMEQTLAKRVPRGAPALGRPAVDSLGELGVSQPVTAIKHVSVRQVGQMQDTCKTPIGRLSHEPAGPAAPRLRLPVPSLPMPVLHIASDQHDPPYCCVVWDEPRAGRHPHARILPSEWAGDALNGISHSQCCGSPQKFASAPVQDLPGRATMLPSQRQPLPGSTKMPLVVPNRFPCP